MLFEAQTGCRSSIIQIKAQQSGFDLRRKKEIAECSFCRKAEAERCELLLTRWKDALSGVSAPLLTDTIQKRYIKLTGTMHTRDIMGTSQ